MPPRSLPPPRAPGRGVSWASLVAATTLGMTAVGEVRARVRGSQDFGGDQQLRLVVQSYRQDGIGRDLHPNHRAVPMASTQRAITAEELRNGVDVRMLRFGLEDVGEADSFVVAWVERGSPTLELDGLGARPPEGAYYGVGRSSDGEIVLHVDRA